MRSIFKLTLANIRHGKGAFKGIIFLMLLITFSFSGTVSNSDRLNEAREKKFDEVGVPELLVSIYDDLLTDDMVSSVEEDEHVKDMCIKDTIQFVSTPIVGGEEKKMTMSLNSFDSDVRVFNDKFDGYEADNSLENGEIYLPYKLKLVDGFSKGTTVTLRTKNGYDESFTVKGFYEDVLFGATTWGDNMCVVAKEDYERIKSQKTDSVMSGERYALIIDQLWINGTGDLSQLELRRELGQRSALISSANSAVTRDHFINNINMYSNIGTRIVAIFTALLLVVVLITMHNSISAAIEMDKTELGILKSQGFTARKISLVYVFQYTLALVIGSVLGIAISVPACRYLISMWKNITGIMSDTGVSVLKCAAMSGAMIVICVVFIFIATAKIGKISPVSAISGGKSDVYFDSRLNVRIRQKAMGLFLALRQLNARRKSYIGTTFIVTLLAFFIVSIMILFQGLDIDNLFTDTTGEIRLINEGAFTLGDIDEIEKDIQKIDSGAVLETESYHRMLVDGELTAVHAYHSHSDPFKPLDGRVPKYDNEIMLTEAVSEQSGKRIGDTIKVSYRDKEEEFVVTGYFQTVWEFGIVTLVTPEGMEKLGNTDIEEAFADISDSSKQQEIIDMLNTEHGDILRAEAFEENNTVTTYKKVVEIIMNSFSFTMYAILLSFAAVIVSMTCKRAFIRERTDIGIFKATGFTVGSLRTQFALRFAVIAFIGSAAGCVLGILFSRKMITYILRIVGLTDFTSDNSLPAFILPALTICLCFYLTAFVSSRRIKTVNVRELITE